MVVGDLPRMAARRFGDREAFFCSATARRFTFHEVNERCNRLANGLTALGLVKGDTVALLSTNRVEVAETYFALAKTGLVGIPMNYRLTPAELLAMMESLDARALIFESGFDELAAEAVRTLGSLSHLIIIEDRGREKGVGHALRVSTNAYEPLLDSSSSEEPRIEIEEDDLFYFNLTSGTSGLPKCYALTHHNNATVWTMFHAMELCSNDVALTVFPMFGRVGFAWCAAGFLYGIPNVLANFDPAAVLKLIESEKVTITNLVPTMAAMMLDCGELPQRKLSSLRGLVFAGSLLSPALRRRINDHIAAPLFEYYGMQETGTLVLSTPYDRIRRPDLVGRAILHAEVRVVDDQGHDVPPSQTGEIIGRAPTSTVAYHQNPAKSAETFRNGWVYTGDLGVLDEEGYLFIRGRKKDMIITGGQNVFAAEVEEAIMSHPDAADCAVVGLPDDLWGERVVAIVVPRDGAKVNSEDIITHCRKQLPGFKTPKQVEFEASSLPYTPTGKVQKFLLVERYGQPTRSAVTPSEKEEAYP